MAASAANPLTKESHIAKITSKGQITIPAEIRRQLGVSTGDQLIFETDTHGEIQVRRVERYPFEKFLGIGTGVPELEEGPEAIIQYFRRERDHDEFDNPD